MNVRDVRVVLFVGSMHHVLFVGNVAKHQLNCHAEYHSTLKHEHSRLLGGKSKSGKSLTHKYS